LYFEKKWDNYKRRPRRRKTMVDERSGVYGEVPRTPRVSHIDSILPEITSLLNSFNFFQPYLGRLKQVTPCPGSKLGPPLVG